MHDDPRIERHIQDILAGSGLSADRRDEVSDELQAHLEQLVEAKRQTGLTEEAAVQAAIADFGQPSRIRHRLRTQSIRSCHREALSDVRSGLPALLIACSLPIAFVVISTFLGLGRTPRALATALAAGSVGYAFLLLSAIVVLYPFIILRIRSSHPLPRSEYRPVRRIGYWFLATWAALLGSELILATGLLAGFFVMAYGAGKSEQMLVDFSMFFVNCSLPGVVLIFAVPAPFLAIALTWIETGEAHAPA